MSRGNIFILVKSRNVPSSKVKMSPLEGTRNGRHAANEHKTTKPVGSETCTAPYAVRCKCAADEIPGLWTDAGAWELVEKEKRTPWDESVHKLMIAEGLWKARKTKKVVVHQLREQRACFGEFIQIDGLPHNWFEGRAERCTRGKKKTLSIGIGNYCLWIQIPCGENVQTSILPDGI